MINYAYSAWQLYRVMSCLWLCVNKSTYCWKWNYNDTMQGRISSIVFGNLLKFGKYLIKKEESTKR